MKEEMRTEGLKHIEAMLNAKTFFSKSAKQIEKEIERLGESDANVDTDKLEDEQDNIESLADDLGDVIKDAKKIFK